MALTPASTTQSGTPAAPLYANTIATIVSILGTSLACLGLLWLSLVVVHPSAAAATRFIGYVLVFNLLPGIVVARILLPQVDSPVVLVINALALGISVNLLVLIPLWAMNQTALISLLPFVAGAVLVVGFRRLGLVRLWAEWRVGLSEARWLAGTIFLVLTALLGIANVLSGDPGDAFSFHFAFQGVIVRGLERGWPPPNLLIPDVPWSYNYAAHLWILGANHVAGVPLDVLVARYGPVFLGGSAAAVMMAFGRCLLGLKWWIAALAVISVFWIVGVPPIAAGVFGTFMPFGATLLLSPFLAIIVFFLVLSFVLAGAPSRGMGRSLILVMLTFLATGARGACPPILMCALALRLCLAWRADRRWPRFQSWDLVAVTVGFGAGLWFFFTLGSGFSGTGFVRITGQPFDFLSAPAQYLLIVPHLLMDAGLGKLLAGALAFALIAFFQAGFLTPALPVCFAALRRQADSAAILLLGSAIAGIAAVFATEAPGYSHFSFLYFANVSLALLGARGLQLLIEGRCWHGRRRAAVLTCFGAVALLACLHLAQLPSLVLTRFVARWAATSTALMTGKSELAPPIADCRRDADVDLFSKASLGGPDPIVVVLPKVRSGQLYCETFWLVVQTPLQVVSDYALAYIPGSATQPLARILTTRVQHMNAAIGLASGGVLSVSDIVAIAATMDRRRPVYLLADNTLSPSVDGGLEWVASNDRFALWRVVLP
ncbi:hypothetical protein [Bosea sp. BIWAKO-01]|uniref:hypothetical protein n=1 Tax=Bosea sp. BIWAKO-01 TaxID=506668 RepID=UPI00086D7E81|nr:hypothetical protein [Bosea sp. BIWAKO-01]GAU83447.1 hypothetical protein BIWAKO_03373 [Bosea sp. BIWAKO-01]